MKLLAPLLAMLAAGRGTARRHAMARLLVTFAGTVAVFAVGFHAIMAMEGRDFAWGDSIYWTLVTMSTLGYGDIVFESQLGRMYSLLVLLTGAVLVLILLPYTFIQHVYTPWREAQRRARAPRNLDEDVTGHLVVTGLGPVEEALLERAKVHGVPSVVQPSMARSIRSRAAGS